MTNMTQPDPQQQAAPTYAKVEGWNREAPIPVVIVKKKKAKAKLTGGFVAFAVVAAIVWAAFLYFSKDYSYSTVSPGTYLVKVDSWSATMSDNIDKADSIAGDIGSDVGRTNVDLIFVCKSNNAPLGTADFQGGLTGYQPSGTGPDFASGTAC